MRQDSFKTRLNPVQKCNKSEEQKKVLGDSNKVYEAWERRYYWFFYDFTTIMFVTKYEAVKVEGIKILTPNQLLDRFSTTFAQVKAGNASDNLLSEIRQIFY